MGSGGTSVRRWASAVLAGEGSRALPLAAASGLLVGIVAGVVIAASGGEAGAQSEGAAEVEVAERDQEATGSAAAGKSAAIEPAAAEPAEAEPTEAEPAETEPAETEPADVEPVKQPEPADVEPVKQPEPVVAALRFEVRPRDVDGLRITVDGQAVDGREHQLELSGGPREVTVVARASGYRRFRTKVSVDGDRRVEIALEKRRRSSGKRNGGPKREPSGPGGLIDL